MRTKPKQVYKGYGIAAVSHQGCRNFIVLEPDGSRMEGGIACDLQTARKWIDADIAERRNRERHT